MIKGIVFDIGGVLSYDIQEYLYGDEKIGIAAKYGLDERELLGVMDSLYDKYAHTTEDNEHRWQEQENEYWNEFKSRTGVEVPNEELIEMTKSFVKPVPGMPEFLKELKSQGYDLLICSNNTEFFYQRQKELLQLGEIVEKRKVILSNHHGLSKSHPEFALFKEIEKQMDFPKDQYIFVDDRKGNIERALQFGIPAIYFPAEAPYGASYLREILSKTT